MKQCAVCGSNVLKGQGLYYARKLIHKKCKPVAKLQRWRL